MNKYLSTKIENISFLSIIMVVFIHSRSYIDKLLDEQQPAVFLNLFIQNFITFGITRVAVPICFTISGYLFFLTLEPTINGFLNKYKSRAKSLLVPYLIWSGWGLLIYYILHLISLPESTFSFIRFLDKNFTLKIFLKNLFFHSSVFTFQLWFLNTLMKLVIISPFIYIAIKRLKSLLVWVLFLMWFTDLSVPLLRSTEGWLFFTIGSYFAITKREI